MKVTTKARYGIRAMIDLALHYGKDPLLLKDIAKRQEVSMKYLEHIISTLKANGLIQSPKGRHGGYVLSRSPSQINAHEIIEGLEGSLASVECVDYPKTCHRANFCAATNLWKKLKQSMTATLKAVTLEDLAKEERELLQRQEENEMHHT